MTRGFPLSVIDIIARTFDVEGRSRRQEIFDYWLAYMLVTVAIGFGVGQVAGREAAGLIKPIFDALYAVPFLALFARRLHDQDRSGWWTLALLPLILANLYDDIRLGALGLAPGWPDLDYPKAPLFILAIAAFILPLLPGSPGPNRYGPDPRIDPEPSVSLG